MGAEKIHEFINYNSENEIEIYLCDMRKLNEIVIEWMDKDSIPVINLKSWKA
jgi:ssRNA-specific RNase YbeY (16S rRNA maturation enzyme)